MNREQEKIINAKISLIIASLLSIVLAIVRFILNYRDSLLVDIPLAVCFIIFLILYNFIKDKKKVLKIYAIAFSVICVAGSILVFEQKKPLLDLFIYTSYLVVALVGLGINYLKNKNIRYYRKEKITA